MTIEVTDEAVAILRRSLEMGGIDPTTGGVRLRGARGLGGGTGIQVELSEGPLPQETVVQAGDVRVFVDPSVTEAMPEAVVAVDPQHDTIVVRPAGP